MAAYKVYRSAGKKFATDAFGSRRDGQTSELNAAKQPCNPKWPVSAQAAVGRGPAEVTGEASCLPVPVVADDDDSLHAVDDSWAHPFSVLQALQPGDCDPAR